jgi:alpha-1,2-mannosyltransferase
MAHDTTGGSRPHPAVRKRRGGYLAFFLVLSVALAAAVGVFFAYMAWHADGIFDQAGYPIGRDFVNQWSAGRLLLTGRMADIFQPASFQAAQAELFGRALPQYIWSYPPPAFFLAAPVGLLPYGWGLALWSLTTAALFCLAATGPRWRPLPVLLLLAAPASLVNIFFGQNGFLTAALLVGGFRLVERRPALAGVAFGLLIFKPQLGLLIPVALLAWRRWPPIVTATLTMLTVLLASLVLFGFEPWRAYLEVALPIQTYSMREGTGAFLNLMPSVFAGARVAGLGASAGLAIQAAVTALVAVAVYRRYRAAPGDPASLALLLVAAVLATPQALNYDLTVVAVAVLYMLPAGGVALEGRGLRIGLPLAWVLPLIVPAFNANGVPASPLILLALLWVLWRQGPAVRPRLTSP